MTCGSVSLGQSFVDDVNFADQLRSELNPFGEEGRYTVSAGDRYCVCSFAIYSFFCLLAVGPTGRVLFITYDQLSVFLRRARR